MPLRALDELVTFRLTYTRTRVHTHTRGPRFASCAALSRSKRATEPVNFIQIKNRRVSNEDLLRHSRMLKIYRRLLSAIVFKPFNQIRFSPVPFPAFFPPACSLCIRFAILLRSSHLDHFIRFKGAKLCNFYLILFDLVEKDKTFNRNRSKFR